jgi:hypothetical protein
MNQTSTATLQAEGDAPAKPVEPTAPKQSMKEQFFIFTERFGHMMSRILLTALYILLVTPAAIFISALGDPLKIRRYKGTSWNPWDRQNETPDQARRQD